MKKLKLNLDQLHVQSYTTGTDEAAGLGTVQGNMRVAPTSECGYTEEECVPGGGGGGSGQTCGCPDTYGQYTCDPYQCGTDYTVNYTCNGCGG
ncbi:MAG TPA: hypothetical protein VF665_04025 [Longimicrobium sp.]|jgi:hypothetical protein|uniref:hypothetical protein n=1 Tax=Longimicrobium sp. TaxID=2029185 RepID=UPI002ED8A41C